MILRDAEAIVVESGKVPTLRRRGQVEALAMTALDPQMLTEFAAPLLVGKSLAEGPLAVEFVDGDTTYQITLEQASAGLRMVARKAAKSAPAKPAAAAAAKPAVASAAIAPAGGAAPITHAATHAPIVEHAPRVERHDRAALVARLTALLGPAIIAARERGGADIVLSTGQPPRVRIDGRIETLELGDSERGDGDGLDAELAACARALAAHEVAEVGVSADLSLEHDGTRVRVNVFDHLGGYALAARLIRDDVPSLGALGLPAELGAIVVISATASCSCAASTGAGKSTTLAALLELLDQRRAAHVITIEDPIEYRFTSRRGIVHQRELGTHVPTFAAGLRAALREAPDVILIGELRDRDTIAAALTAAETGHLVLATLHASSAAGAIDRVIDAFPEGQQRQDPQPARRLAAHDRHAVPAAAHPTAGARRAIELVCRSPRRSATSFARATCTRYRRRSNRAARPA